MTDPMSFRHLLWFRFQHTICTNGIHLSSLFSPFLKRRNLLARAHKVQIRAPNRGVGDPPGVLRRAQYVDSGHVSSIRSEGLDLRG